MTTARPNHQWAWVFLAFFGLAVIAISILLIFKSRQQLTPKMLENAQQLWKENGPRDYDLTYQTRFGEGGTVDKTYVRVRGGKVQSVTRNMTFEEAEALERENAVAREKGKPTKHVPKEPESRFAHYGMPALFDQIDGFLTIDAKPDAPRVYAIADFDAHDGHLLRFIRSVSATRERQEIAVEEFKNLSK